MKAKNTRKGILYIPLSSNADSMLNILNIVFSDECCKDNNLPLVEKITILESTNSDTFVRAGGKEMDPAEFLRMIREEFKDSCIEIRLRTVNSYAKDVPHIIMDGVREVGKENIIIDLTCGKKDITGSLYTTASISQISNMIYVDVLRIDGMFPKLDRSDYKNMKDKFKLTRYESLNEIENLASLNEMDFIFYKKNVQELLQKTDPSSFKNVSEDMRTKAESFCSQISHIIEEYFSDNADNYVNAVREMGLISEEITKTMGKALHKKYIDILDNKEYDENRSLDCTIWTLQKLYDEKKKPGNRQQKVKKEMIEPVFSVMPTMYESLEIFRKYRNKTSHYDEYKNSDCFITKGEVKILLDMLLLMLNRIYDSELSSMMWGNNTNE